MILVNLFSPLFRICSFFNTRSQDDNNCENHVVSHGSNRSPMNINDRVLTSPTSYDYYYSRCQVHGLIAICRFVACSWKPPWRESPTSSRQASRWSLINWVFFWPKVDKRSSSMKSGDMLTIMGGIMNRIQSCVHDCTICGNKCTIFPILLIL